MDRIEFVGARKERKARAERKALNADIHKDRKDLRHDRHEKH